MVTFVIKKNGEKVPFDERKVQDSILAAAREAGFDDQKASAVALEVSKMVLDSLVKQDSISTRELKGKIIFQLDAIYPEVSASWRQYDQSQNKQ